MNNFGFDILSFIFKNLDLIDLMSCSGVCLKWKEMINLKNLFICYGIGFLPKKKCHNNFLELHQKQFSKPHFTTDELIFEYLKSEFCDNVEILIIHENLNLKLSRLFNFKMLPNLKYLEIKDSNFCEIILEEFQRFIDKKDLKEIVSSKFYNSSIETLVIDFIDSVMLFTCFPNLKNLELNHSFRKFYSLWFFINKMENLKNLTLNEYYEEDSRLLLTTDKFPLLSSIKVKTDCSYMLKRLLCHTNFKNICVKAYCSLKNFGSVISDYESILKDCDLCINNFNIKNLDDFESLVKEFEFYQTLHQNNKNYLDIEDFENYFKIVHQSGIELYKTFKSFSVIDRIENVSISNENNFEHYLPELFSILPNTIKYLRIFSENKISEEIIKLIPGHFSFLKTLHLNTLNSRIDDCEFISNLKYLQEIKLSYLNLNFTSLVCALEKLNFIHNIKIDFVTKEIFKILCLFKCFFEKKKNSFTIRLSLNKKKYTLYNIRTILRQNKISKIN